MFTWDHVVFCRSSVSAVSLSRLSQSYPRGEIRGLEHCINIRSRSHDPIIRSSSKRCVMVMLMLKLASSPGWDETRGKDELQLGFHCFKQLSTWTNPRCWTGSVLSFIRSRKAFFQIFTASPLVPEKDDWIRVGSRGNFLDHVDLHGSLLQLFSWCESGHHVWRRLYTPQTIPLISSLQRSDCRSQMEPIPPVIFMPFLPLLSAVYTHSYFFKHWICISDCWSKASEMTKKWRGKR